MNMKNKTVTFVPYLKEYENIFDPPIAAKKMLPEWFKKQERYSGGVKRIQDENGLFNSTIKACSPVFDMITAGYVVTTPADIIVSKKEGKTFPSFTWGIQGFKCIESHPISQYDEYKIPDEYFPVGFKFNNPWTIVTPKGYSSLILTPTFRDDLPFFSLPALVDTDKHPSPILFPFFIRKDFEGIIPMGTPIVQIIPFKRDSWSTKTEKFDQSLYESWKRSERLSESRYKTFFRSKKTWE
jgi:hypothetical protein